MISVILPVYNGEKYLREAIDSVLNQTFSDFEFLILNDGSTDSTEEIVKSYSDFRIRYFSLEHKGLPSTLNFGLQEAKFDYIARMDADDVCHPQRFSKQISFLADNPSIGVLGTNQYEFFDNINNLKKKIYPETNSQIKSFLPHTCCLSHPTIIFKKKLILEYGGYDHFYIAQDWSLYLKIYEKVVFHNLQEYLLYYRKNLFGLTSAKKDLFYEEEEICKSFCFSQIQNQENDKMFKAKKYFDLGYFYYLRDNNRYNKYFRKAFLLNKMNVRYVYFLTVGLFLRPFVIFFRKSRIIKLFSPIKKLDKNNLFFRREF